MTFDGTIVVQDGRRYDDLDTPLEFQPGAREALYAIKAADHALLLWSARASRALREDPDFDPMIRAGVRQWDQAAWDASKELNQARYEQMLAFVETELPDVFDAIDDGLGSKPLVDLFIDDKSMRFGQGPGCVNWPELTMVLGEVPVG